jgi:hypothetical protein
MFLLMCLGMVGVTWAVEVISIDINGYDPNAPAYIGEAAVPGATQWIAYCGGWGVPAGSSRSADLAKYGTIQPSTYARQVWVGDSGINHGYVYGTGLMDDGFEKSAGAIADPNLYLWGRDAYGGTFDMYVYGQQAGSFTVVAGTFNQTKTVSGSVPAGQFVENGNYVVFPNIQIGDPNGCRIYYTNTLNGIQLVSLKQPKAIVASTDPNSNVIDARQYDVARDINSRGNQSYGPDMGSGTGGTVNYLDQGEYMVYDITVGPGQEGQYSLAARVQTNIDNNAANLTMYLDGKAIPGGTLTYPADMSGAFNLTNTVTINLFEGSHTLKWAAETSNIYFNIASLYPVYMGPISFASCDEVFFYGLNLPGDANKDCRVDLTDLLLIAAEWTNDYNPF